MASQPAKSLKANTIGKQAKSDLPEALFSEPYNESLVHEAAQHRSFSLYIDKLIPVPQIILTMFLSYIIAEVCVPTCLPYNFYQYGRLDFVYTCCSRY